MADTGTSGSGGQRQSILAGSGAGNTAASTSTATPASSSSAPVANGAKTASSEVVIEENPSPAVRNNKGKGFPLGKVLLGALVIYILICLALGAAGMSYPGSFATYALFGTFANALIYSAHGDAGNLGHFFVLVFWLVFVWGWFVAGSKARK